SRPDSWAPSAAAICSSRTPRIWRQLAQRLLPARAFDRSGTRARMKSYSEYLLLLEARGALASDCDLELLAGAMLDGGIPDVELGALLATVRARTASGDLLRALLAALDTRVTRWRSEARSVPVVIGCYGGAADVPNLTP